MSIYRKIASRYGVLLFVCIIALSVFITVKLCYAGVRPENHQTAPEPSSIALFSMGIVGSIVRFARKKFRQFKKCFDIVMGFTGLIMATPLIALTALFIKVVSPGPAFFKQERVGLNGRRFNIYKMRTMKVDAEKESGAVWAQENDPRFIPFGKLIRKCHLDELPQFVNVLKGEMSIVGPRPERPVFVDKLKKEIPDYEKRLLVKPGITGLAQVWHKYDETIDDVKKKIRYDLLYIRKMCIMVDLRILANTIVAAFTGRGAR